MITSNKLNVGSGCMLNADYVNFDAREVKRGGLKTDVVGQIQDILEIFEAGRFKEIICFHVLEHLIPDEGEKMIADCYALLRLGGKLILEAPDIIGCLELYQEKHPAVPLEMVLRTLYGHNTDQWKDLGYHRWGYTRDTGAELVEKHGFKITHKGIGMSHGMGKRDFRIEGIKE